MVEKVYKRVSYVLAFSIAFPQKVSSLILLLWFITFLLYKGTQGKKLERLEEKKLPAAFAVGYSVVLLLTAVYAKDPYLVFDQLFTSSLPFLVLPLCALCGVGDLKFEKMLKFFVIGTFCSLVYMFLFFFWQFFVNGNVLLHRDLFGEQTLVFSYFTHRTYFGVNIALSLFAILHFYRKKLIERKDYLFYVSFIVLSFLFIIVNNSRIITFVLILSAGIFVLLQIRQGSKFYMLKVILGGIIVACLFFFVPSRFSNSIESLFDNKFDDPRLEIWDSAMHLVEEEPVFGYGCANWQKELVDRYKVDGHDSCYLFQFGVHSQYIGAWLDAGVVGLAFVIALLLSIFWYSKKIKDKRLLAFLTAILFVFLFVVEASIGRYYGALSMGFMLMLLSLKDGVENEKLPIEPRAKCVCVALACVAIISYVSCVFEFKSDTTPYYVLNRSEEKRSAVKRLPIDCEGKRVADVVDKSQKRKFFHKGASFFYEMAAYYRKGIEDQPKFFSTDCYVSEDFDGEWVRICTEPSFRKDTMLKTVECRYDMSKKGTWQNLKIELPAGNQTVFLYTKVDSCFDLRNIKGFAVFADTKMTDYD